MQQESFLANRKYFFSWRLHGHSSLWWLQRHLQKVYLIFLWKHAPWSPYNAVCYPFLFQPPDPLMATTNGVSPPWQLCIIDASCDKMDQAFCANFVLQATNVQGLGMRLVTHPILNLLCLWSQHANDSISLHTDLLKIDGSCIKVYSPSGNSVYILLQVTIFQWYRNISYMYWFYQQFPNVNEFPSFSGNDCACTNMVREQG